MGSRPLGVREPVYVPGLPVLGGKEPVAVTEAPGEARCKAAVMSRPPQERFRGAPAAYDQQVPGT